MAPGALTADWYSSPFGFMLMFICNSLHFPDFIYTTDLFQISAAMPRKAALLLPCKIFIITRNCSVPSQLRAKIHFKSAAPIGFLPSSLCFLTVSAVNAQTY